MTKEELIVEGLKWQIALTNYAQGQLREWNLAEDAVQKAYLTAFEKADSFEEGAPVFPWLRGIVRLKCLEIIRERSKIKAAPDDHLDELINQRMEEQWDEAYIEAKNQKEQALNHCLKKLKPNLLELMLQYYRDKVPGEIIARKLNRPINSLYVTISRTRQKVRDCCQKYMKESLS